MNPAHDNPQNVEDDRPQRSKDSDAGCGNPWQAAGGGLGAFGAGLMPRTKPAG